MQNKNVLLLSQNTTSAENFISIKFSVLMKTSLFVKWRSLDDVKSFPISSKDRFEYVLVKFWNLLAVALVFYV